MWRHPLYPDTATGWPYTDSRVNTQAVMRVGALSGVEQKSCLGGSNAKVRTRDQIRSPQSDGQSLKTALCLGGSLAVPGTAACSVPSTALCELRDSLRLTVVVWSYRPRPASGPRYGHRRYTGLKHSGKPHHPVKRKENYCPNHIAAVAKFRKEKMP